MDVDRVSSRLDMLVSGGEGGQTTIPPSSQSRPGRRDLCVSDEASCNCSNASMSEATEEVGGQYRRRWIEILGGLEPY